MVELPFETTTTIYIAGLSLSLALLTFLVLSLNRIKRTISRIRLRKVKRISLSQHTLRFLFTLLWVAVSAAILFLAAFLQSYRTFAKKELIAEIRCHAVEDSDRTMLLELTPIVAGVKQAPEGFLIKGDQWAIEGHVLKWHNWINFIGLHTMYKMVRIRGRFLAAVDEARNIPTVHSLVEREDASGWRLLYKYGHRLPGVAAVYGNTVFTYPSDSAVFELFATTSGFSVAVRP